MADDFDSGAIKTKSRDINYLGKDFNAFRRNLMNYAKSYFPQTYKDFSENSTGMMFIEMVSYVGDVLSYYIDYQFKEGFMQHAEERKNVVTLANYLGYKPKPSIAASTELEVFQLVPAKSNSENGQPEPDYKYALNISSGMEVTSSDDSATIFRTLEPVNFTEDTEENSRAVSVFDRDPTTKEPTFYLIKKKVMAAAGELKVREVTVNEPESFYEIDLIEPNVLEIVSIQDSEGNRYYEVPYLAQDTLFIEEPNVDKRNPFYSKYAETTPYILRLLRTSRRFITRINSDNTITLEFGAGTDKLDDEIIIPSLNNVGRVLDAERSFEVAYDPSNFLKTKSYGEAPSNTTLIVQYYVGGGVSSNIGSNTLNAISSIRYDDQSQYLTDQEASILNAIKSSVRVNNPDPAMGGEDSENTDEIRLNALAHFSSQNRAVTREDCVVRAYAMPNKFGSIAKAYVTPDGILDTKTQLSMIDSLEQQTTKVSPGGLTAAYGEINNPFAINLYVLSYDKNKHLVGPNELILKNLRTYMGQYKMLTDGINITNAFIINIGVDLEISVFQNYNKIAVLKETISAVKTFFSIDKWQISQPIELGDLELDIARVRGVKSIISLRIYNKTIEDGNYSHNVYDIESATFNKVIYPSMDPSIFELKFPTRDVVGRVIQ
jgi:hypothetical protein